MLGAMYEAADHGRRKLRPADGPEITEGRRINPSQLRDGRIDARIERGQNHWNTLLVELRAFQSQRLELRLGECLAARVGKQPVDDSRDVPHVKRGRRDTSGSRVPFITCQVLDQLPNALPHLQKDVRDRLQYVRDAFDGSALPPLGV